MLHSPDPVTGILRHAWIELTYKCDLECLHCYNDSGPSRTVTSPLSRDAYMVLLGELKELGCRSVQFIGGEPSLHPHLADFVSTAAVLGFEKIEVFSNLTHLSERLITTLQGSKASVACSFYSDLEDVHDAITTRKGSQKRTIRSIERLIAAKIPVRVGIVVIKGLNDDRVIETRRYLESHGISAIKVDKARAIGRSRQETLDSNGVLHELCGRCADGNVCIDPDGNVSPCVMSRAWKLGTVRESSIDAMLGSRSWKEFARMLRAVQSNHVNEAGCSPEDNCNPGACHPQIGGPPDCMPQTSCAPDVLPDE